MVKPETDEKNTPPSVNNADPFNPAALRLSQDFGGTVGVEKLLTTVHVGKPHKQAFVRVHPDENYRLTTMILKNDDDGEAYLVGPNMHAVLAGDATVVTLVTVVNRQGAVSIWPLTLPKEDGKPNAWHASAIEAAARAEKDWIRVVSNMSLGANEMLVATSDLPEPEWPDKPFNEILKVAFCERFIDTPNHPVVQKLQGRI